jgi:8-oxo-dGTP diphosphatase
VWVVGAVVLDSAGRAFVQLRGPDRRLFPGTWDIVGGHVEVGEKLLEALAREVREETGWVLRRVVRGLGVGTWEADGVLRHSADFVVEVDGDLERPALEWDKHPRFAWVGADDLPMLLANRDPGDTAIRDIVAAALRA